MKKTYINPTMEIVKIQTMGMLAMSKIGEVTDPLAREEDEGYEW